MTVGMKGRMDAFASIYHTNVAGNLSLESLHRWTALVRPRLQMLNHFPKTSSAAEPHHRPNTLL